MSKHAPVIERMLAQIDIWEQNADRRAIFLSCYVQMTQNMLQAIKQGEFHDPTWVGNLVVHFADFYFNALQSYETRAEFLPRPWRTTLDAAQDPSVHVLQHLLLGINAHINYDLCFSIENALRPEWESLDAASRQQRYADHCHINQVIARTIDAVQDTVIERYSPSMDLVDRFMGRLDEQIMIQMIRSWRNEVWEQAVSLVEADPQERTLCSLSIENQADRRAQQLLRRKFSWILEDIF